MTPNHRQEAVARAWVEAVAAHAGVSISHPRPDYGIDLVLNHVQRRGTGYSESGFKFDVQLKSTASDDDLTGDVWYDLDVRAYTALRHPAPPTPRLLVLVVLPKDESAWTTSGPDGLTTRRRAFWANLAGQPAVPNRRTVRVSISAGNDFTPAALAALFAQLRRKPR